MGNKTSLKKIYESMSIYVKGGDKFSNVHLPISVLYFPCPKIVHFFVPSDNTSSKHKMESFEKSLDAAENNYRLILGEYRLNLVTLIDVFDALTALESARDDY